MKGAHYLGLIEFKEGEEWHTFECFETVTAPHKVVFGGFTNNGFLESGYIHVADCESVNEALEELVSELETYYRDGAQYVTRIIVNERM